jgi:hypothetical protein
MSKQIMDTVSIQYCFTLPDGKEEVFDLHLQSRNLELVIETPTEKLPPWTDLIFHQCLNCPLTPDTHTHCPVAAKLADLVRRFDRLLSYETIHMIVKTDERVISQQTTAQKGLSSLMGLVIANSGCPHTTFFRPMGRFHLPLANVEETLFRATSMYLLAQYFLHQEGREADFNLDGLEKIYEDIHIVNSAMAERLRYASSTDLSPNAVILLDLYALAFPHAFGRTLQNIRCLFTPFLGLCERFRDEETL